MKYLMVIAMTILSLSSKSFAQSTSPTCLDAIKAAYLAGVDVGRANAKFEPLYLAASSPSPVTARDPVLFAAATVATEAQEKAAYALARANEVCRGTN
ncbi:MAG: hypothetical protein EOP06_06340 [Proteobacteria bacterium]|nr:MAG: hypothetical protein EOP06_06340 [Pseudomonadota bacterium]